MKRLALVLGLAVVLFAGVGLMADTDAAFADHSHGRWEGATSVADGPSPAPVGSHIVDPTLHEEGSQDFRPGHPGSDNGFFSATSNAAVGIGNNPNCPVHWGGGAPNNHL